MFKGCGAFASFFWLVMGAVALTSNQLGFVGLLVMIWCFRELGGFYNRLERRDKRDVRTGKYKPSAW